MKKEKIKTHTVWDLPYGKRYYITHPWKLVKNIGQNIRAAYMRARYGWTYGDVWDWDMWFLNVVPPMFRYLAEHGHAYPGYEPFETPEKWREWLNEMADLLDTAKEGWQDEHNEYYKAYINESWKPVRKMDENGYIHTTIPEPSELSKKYHTRAKELYEQGEKNLRFVLSQIAEHFYSIWD